MEPRRVDWRLGDALEAQVEHRSALDGEPRLEGIRLVGQPLGADHRLPEPAQPLRLDGIEYEVLQIHEPTVGPSRRGHRKPWRQPGARLRRRRDSYLAVTTEACRMRTHREQSRPQLRGRLVKHRISTTAASLNYPVVSVGLGSSASGQLHSLPSLILASWCRAGTLVVKLIIGRGGEP